MEKGDFIGEVSKEYIARAEKILEVNFPPEYKEFVKKFGSGGICGVDVLGVEGADYASVVESTKRYRKLGLPKKYIVIENVDEFVYCLSTLDEYNVVRWDDISKKNYINIQRLMNIYKIAFRRQLITEIDGCIIMELYN